MRHLAAILSLLALACARPMPPVSGEDSLLAAESASFATAERVRLDSMRTRLDDPWTRCFQVEVMAPRPNDIRAWQLALDTLPSRYGATPRRHAAHVRRADGTLPELRRLWARTASTQLGGRWQSQPDKFWFALADSLHAGVEWGVAGASLSGGAPGPAGRRTGFVRWYSDVAREAIPVDTIAWRPIPCAEMSPPR